MGARAVQLVIDQIRGNGETTSVRLPALAQQAAPTPTPVALDTFNPSAAGGRTVVKWYVGLGTGAQPSQIDNERKVVDQFNPPSI